MTFDINDTSRNNQLPSSTLEAKSSPLASPSTGPKPPISSIISTCDFEAVAYQTLSPKTWAFISSAAADLHTKERNRTAFADIALRPRALRDVSRVDTSVSMLGQNLRLPLFCSPVAMAHLVHAQGEKDIGRACKASGVAQCISTSASYPLGEIVAAVEEHPSPRACDVPIFFQLYMDKNRNRSRELLQAAQRGGVKAIFLTIDAPVPGKRELDERTSPDVAISSPLSGATAGSDHKGSSWGRTMGGFIDASLSWGDIPWIRSCVPGLPIVLKGIQTSEDAVMAMEAGMDAIVISNHGGRSLDTAPASILVLLELARNVPQVFKAMEVYVDGGIRRGTDIFKALCLGARAVGVGRGPLYAANYGKEGVLRYFDSKCATGGRATTWSKANQT
ncbi:hypothetical protein UVI_02022260 [Ustilaginoidea virens]|uniref:FMN hydroxy acid dehydrogenase domain-containing protein n=1 Tax=Ustilaginoidea virens TaxID=1159556 RepID=A0A1B5L1V1_USTVR|nr:hypothetical protein UVI_02022260 [Ustilaginoidea virens]